MKPGIISFKAARPDPRVWMFLVVCILLLTFPCGSRLELFIMFILLALIMLGQQMTAAVVRFAAIYTLLLLSAELCRFIPWPSAGMLVGMLTLLLGRLIPVYMACVILLEKVQMNELITALEQMHVPSVLIIPLAVVYRYLPTLRREMGHISDSLKMRGLRFSPVGLMLQPVATVERFMIPLLIRSGKLADELAAAALCKGLDAGQRRSSCSDVRFRRQDAAWCALCGAVAAAMLCFHYYPITLLNG